MKKKKILQKVDPLRVWGEPKIFLSKCFFFLIKGITRSFMLNDKNEKEKNENKHFANISILFVMKLIAQINNQLLSKSTLKYLVYCQVFWNEV